MYEYLIDKLEYNKWADAACLNSLKFDGCDDAMLLQMSHQMAAQAIWLSRLTGNPQDINVWETLPLETLESMAASLYSDWHAFLSSQPNLEASISYTNTKGIAFNNLAKDIIHHVFNHATYHRAQIASMVRAKGGTPANTDFISYKRL